MYNQGRFVHSLAVAICPLNIANGEMDNLGTDS